MKKLTLFLALIFSAIIFIISCHKDDMPTSDGGSGSSSSLRTTISGIVLDESNAPLNGATVAAYGQTTTTNQYGIFVLKNLSVNKDRCVLQISKAGFFNRAHGFIASANTVNYVRIILISNTATQNFSSSAGGTVSLPDGSSAVFQPNSFATSSGSAYTGTVNIAFKHLSPDVANFGFMIPGGDLAGKDVNNKDVALYTYGMLGVVLTGSSGETLQLATGITATLTFAIAASQTATSPASIPLWYFDETTSLWKEQGSANKVGNNYVGTVSHFSWWNCDYPGFRVSSNGKVIDCNGSSVSNTVVTFDGWATTITDQNGEYHGMVPSGIQITVQVLASNNSGIISDSQVETIPPLLPNQTYQVDDLVVPCNTRVIGSTKSCGGEITDCFVTISNSTFFNYQYTLNGSFNLSLISNTHFDLDVFNSNASYHQVLTSLTAPNILNIGNILLCDPIFSDENSIQVNCSPLNIHTSYSFDTTGCIGKVISGHINVNMQVDSNFISVNCLGIASGTYNWSSTNTTNSIASYFPGVWVATDSSTIGSMNITVQNVGERIKGIFTGTAKIHNNSGGIALGFINGKFNVPRIQ